MFKIIKNCYTKRRKIYQIRVLLKNVDKSVLNIQKVRFLLDLCLTLEQISISIPLAQEEL